MSTTDSVSTSECSALACVISCHQQDTKTIVSSMSSKSGNAVKHADEHGGPSMYKKTSSTTGEAAIILSDLRSEDKHLVSMRFN